MGWARRHPVFAGAGIGLVWGVVMRGWMRFITEDPEFSWAGTGFILGASVMVGAVLGLARLRRRAGGIGWWRLSMFGLLLLGAGGSVMWPSVVLGAIAVGRPRPAWLRWVLGLAAVGAQVPIMREAAFDNWRLSTWEAVMAVAWYTPMIALEVWAFSVAFAPPMEGAPAMGRVKKLVLAAPMAAMVVMAAIASGVAGDM